MSVASLVDHAAESIADRGLERAHLVGNSLGGWVALELAERGLASSVLALSPAGFWRGAEDPATEHLSKVFTQAYNRARRSRPIVRVAFRTAAARRSAFRGVALHGDRLTRAEALELAAGVLAVPDYAALFDSDRAGARELYQPACPVSILFGEHDHYFPPGPYCEEVRRRVPGAQVGVMPRVGHVPMIDEPKLVATTIRQWVNVAQDPAS